MKFLQTLKVSFKLLFLFRNFIIIILFFQITNCLSQNKDIYGTVHYTYKPNENNLLNNNKTKQDVKDLFKGLKEYMADVKFKLEFFNQTSIFTVSDKMDSDVKSNGSLIADRLISNGSYFTDFKKDIQYRKVEREGLLIESQPSKIKWVLSQETKFIKSYKCYKATTSITNKNFSGIYTFEIIAWYAPEISVPFGPKQFFGLPGLILELKDTHNTFYVDKIELFPKEKPAIKPFKGKIITEEKYKERIREMMGGFIKR